ncbi:MAG: hypothetical protein P8Y79_03165 [Ignavibacteriaceae bacterium]
MSNQKTIEQKVVRFIHEKDLISNKDKILVALSGGPVNFAGNWPQKTEFRFFKRLKTLGFLRRKKAYHSKKPAGK